MNTGEQIKKFRMERGYTVNKLANLAGISQSYLRDIELGKKNPTVEILSYICDALHISLADFFNDYYHADADADPLLKEICRLSPSQKEALTNFLHTITKD